MPNTYETTQNVILKEFKYYSEYSDELLKALESEHGYQICKQLANVFKLIKEANNYAKSI